MTMKITGYLSLLLSAGLALASCTIEEEDPDEDTSARSDDDDADDDASDDDNGGAGGASGSANDDDATGGADDEAGGAGGADDDGADDEAGGAGGADDDEASGGTDAGGASATAGSGGASDDEGTSGAGGADDEPVVGVSSLVQIVGATFIEGGGPDTNNDDESPTLTTPEHVINGGTATYGIGFTAGADKLLISVEADTGYFELPVDADATSIELNITLLQTFSYPNLGILVATQDSEGGVSAWVRKTIPVTETKAGALKISLSFDQDVDADLHVFAPNDEHVYYSARNAASGGELDLDSNPGCSIDGVNNENITWEEDSVPEGEYVVGVDYFASCSVTEDINYIVTVTIGDEIETYTGILEADEADGDWETGMHEVVTFTYGG